MEDDFQSFIVTRPNMILQVVLYLMFIPSEIYLLQNFRLSFWGSFLIIITIYILTSFSLRHIFKWSKTVELCKDQLVIRKGKKIEVIEYSNIKRIPNIMEGPVVALAPGFL